ncbi:MAG: hypothetical protein A3F84_24425 [Candidatus Handelsmanbacteria bacterium RIFCSPLOWO2_12_FULL_64_10]|uniref:DUF1640 domain-containing protein n=1 Tax=Handelsmanbacteria sp. (strain RIFCSPLOWO2_12_FULL_64_10) TaxID=1817868 RepID=A0A1F6CMW2_HANXR|nr:MAG: hypothetical protein A3F84_24425 [Candidatus Handelsmanbacteria bacterium RIFCSPLOWO2_12_FULL_64_10]
MPLSSVELYEQLKPQLGEDGTKALIEYVDGKIRGEVATKEDLAPIKEDIHLLKRDLLLLKADLEKQIQGVKTDLEKQIQGLRADLEKKVQDVKMLVIVVLIVVIILNPKVVELVGRILGVVK